MQEKLNENYLINLVKSHRGIAYKFNAGIRGVPDRIVLLPGGRIFFAELKAPGKKPRPLQLKRIKEIRDLGFKVEVLDNKNKIDQCIKDVMS